VEVTIGESTAAVSPLSQAAMERITSFYDRAIASLEADADNDMWTVLREQFFGSLVNLLRTNDVNGLRDYLMSLPRQPAGHGSYQGQPAYDAAHERGLGRSLLTLNALFGFAEAAGTLRPRSPEQSGEQDAPQIAPIVDELEMAIGFPLVLPPVSAGLLGPIVGDGILHLRHLTAAYLAWRLRSLADGPMHSSAGDLHVCEIGGGAGLAAYYAPKAGIRRWTSVDLPEMCVVQAFNLMTLLGPDNVRLWGEAAAPTQTVTIVPNHIHLDMPTEADIVVNQDSLPEIGRSEAAHYLRLLPSTTSWFLSINQEHEAPQIEGANQSVVGDLMAETGNPRPWYRMPYWLRIGYVEELYRIA
jgi:hypothetical protein